MCAYIEPQQCSMSSSGSFLCVMHNHKQKHGSVFCLTLKCLHFRNPYIDSDFEEEEDEDYNIKPMRIDLDLAISAYSNSRKWVQSASPCSESLFSHIPQVCPNMYLHMMYNKTLSKI